MTDKIYALEAELKSHEVQCEERWKTTFNRLEEIEDTLQRIEDKLIKVAGALILFLGGLVISLGTIVLERL